jgi:signal transduction histidine kinase
MGVLAIATFVVTRSKKPAFRLYGLFSAGLALWLFFQFLTDAQVPGGLLWIQLASASSGFLALLFPIFAYIYPNYRQLPKGWLLLALVPVVVMVPLSFTQLFVKSIAYTPYGVDFSAGPLFGIQTLLLITYFLSGVFILIKRLVHTTPVQRPQLYSLLAAFVAGLIGVTLAGFIFPNSEYWQAARPLGILALVCITGYAMAYRGLFDIHFFVVRAAAYLTSLFALTLVFVAPIILALNHFLGIHISTTQLMASIFFGGCLLSFLQFLRQKFDKVTSRVFFRHYYDPQDVLDKLSDVLVRTADIGILRSETARILQEALRPGQLKYILFADQAKKETQLAKRIDAYVMINGLKISDTDEIGDSSNGLAVALKGEDIALAVKLRTTHEDLGYMVIGYKQSGEAYLERDKRLLSLAADEIAISLQNALRFQEIQQFNITLQERVDEATRKLRETNKKLVELDETKDDFISMASHQLRTPLTSVKGYLSMVLEGDAGSLNDRQAKMLRQAFSSSQRMVYLITDLLNISRLRTGKFVIDATPADLSELAREEVAGLLETAKLKDIELTYQKPAAFPKLMLDETKTRQVVMNFIDNAIYYTPTGGHIRLELEEKPATVELRVVDDGMGVPKSEQHHMFTKFYRAANARKSRPDGTGLGLFMAKKVVTAQGGSVIFSSREGQGSTFGFVFSKTHLKVPAHPDPQQAMAVVKK